MEGCLAGDGRLEAAGWLRCAMVAGWLRCAMVAG